MKIFRIKIQNFRSIEDIDLTCDDFNIIVGQNNCGKTNFFEAIEFFFNGPGRGGLSPDLKFKRESNRHISVSIEFQNAQDGMLKMQNEGNRTKIQKALNEANVVTIVRSSEGDPKKRQMYVNGEEVKPGTGFDAALNDFLPKFEYVSTKQYYDSVAKYNKSTPIGIMLSGVLSTILESNEQYREFQDRFKDLFESDDSSIKKEFDIVGGKVKINLEKQFPDTTSVRFEVTPPVFDDLLKNFETAVDDGIETTAEEKGDGMQRALMLAIIQTYAEYRKEREDAGKSFLFFIDEAELHLHPTAQRHLKNVLHELSQGLDQVFINTHSSVFVADNYGNQQIMKAEKMDGATSINVIEESEKPYIIFELLGGSPSDLLLPNNFLIVEGTSELEFLSRIIRRFYNNQPRIQIITANGDTNQAERTINAIEKSYLALNQSIYGSRLVLLIDQPSVNAEGGVREFKRRFQNIIDNNQLFELTVRDIEQYYPDHEDDTYGNWKKSQQDIDAVNADGKKLFTSHKKKQLAKHVGESISQEDFESEMPIVYQALQRAWELAF